jgi:rhodanese-related sulfurtransferase
MIYHFVNDEGFMAHPNATASIQQAHIGNFIPKVRKKELAELLNTDAVLIDARFACDFEEEHLEGAINIPVDANDRQYREVLANIDKSARIVVYCQSGGCGFAERVAVKLMSDGFSNVSMFKGDGHELRTRTDK